MPKPTTLPDEVAVLRHDLQVYAYRFAYERHGDIWWLVSSECCFMQDVGKQYESWFNRGPFNPHDPKVIQPRGLDPYASWPGLWAGVLGNYLGVRNA